MCDQSAAAVAGDLDPCCREKKIKRGGDPVVAHSDFGRDVEEVARSQRDGADDPADGELACAFLE